jgi:Mrp family chromosome partitioning ATPase
VIKQKIDVETKKLVDNGLELLRFQRNLDIDKSIYVLLRQEYEKSRIAEAGELGTTRVVNWASEPEKPIAPKKGLNLLLALLVGLTLGTGLAFVREQLDNTFKSPKEIEKELGIANLGVVFAIEPRRAGGAPGPQLIAETLIVDRDAADLDFNAYLTLEANLRFASLDRPMRSLLVTSSVPREGKSTTAANLGLVLSVVGKKTLLVDGDLRKPVFAQLFGLRGGKGLSDLALSEIALNEVLQRPADQRHFLELHLAEKLVAGGYLTQKQLDRAMRDFRPSDHEPYLGDLLVNAGLLSADDHAQILQQRRQKLAHLWVLPAGTMPPNPTALLGSERMDEILKELEERFDLVVFDSPPVTAVPDASVLSTKVDGTLLVIEAERTERDAARHAVDQLRRAGGNLIGFILNFLQKSKASYYGSYYSSSYYGYVGAQRDADAHRR